MIPYPTENNHRGGPDTSIDAAAQAALTAGSLRYLVHRIIFDHPTGLTCDEVCAKAKLPRYSLQPRFSELRKLKLIRDTGLRRHNASGALAIVWRSAVLDAPEFAA